MLDVRGSLRCEDGERAVRDEREEEGEDWEKVNLQFLFFFVRGINTQAPTVSLIMQF